MKPLAVAAVLCSVLGSVQAAAEAPPEQTSAATASRAGVRAVRTTSHISVDGVLSEPVWSHPYPVTELKERDPVEGATPREKSEIRVVYDDDAIYVGARLFDTHADSILARLSRRDVSVPADRFSFYLDPLHDRRSGYYFLVNAAGTLFDGTLSNDGWEDSSWDGVWEGSARIDSLGWTCEMRIPYSQLRFQKAHECVWGVNFRRVVARYTEETFLVYQPKKESGFVSRWPDLVGIEDVSPGRSIELLPYMTTKAAYLQHAPADPFNDGSRYTPSVGGDLRMGVGSRLTLNGTVNPDFGQVEVDPAVVNLSDVESYFQEKRPFFVEGSANFNFGQEGADSYWGFNWPQPTFFYSRRIGRTPQGSVPDSTFVDQPVGTSILGAVKLNGKLGSSWNLGTLHAVTDKETAKLAGSFGGRARTEVEPAAYYGVFRTLKEFPRRRYGLGFLTTAANRFFDDRSLRDQVNSTSLVTGIDGWVFLDSSQTWVISGWSAASHVRGSEGRISALQQNSAHYFQRPDARHVGVDPDATSLTGFGSRYTLNRQKGNMIFNSALGFLSPKFDVNDVGYTTRSDVINGHLGGGYKWTQTTKSRLYQDVIGALFGSFDFDGNRTWSGVYVAGTTEFANSNSWNYNFAYNPPNITTRRTRGGPRMVNRPGFQLGQYFDTDSKKKWFYFFDIGGYAQPQAKSYSWYFYPGVELKPASNLTVRFGPQIDRVREDAQYIATVSDPLATATYGNRYVFGTLDQTTISTQWRVNWAFTPKVSLQMFVQPLFSFGDYRDYKELARPKSYDFNRYEKGVEYDPATGDVDPDGSGPAPSFNVGQPDFRILSLRGNAVLRWEYMPGSALYLVWTQQRDDYDPVGNFDFGNAVHGLMKADANNIFFVKVSYYMGL